MFTRRQLVKVGLIAFGLGSFAQAIGYAIGTWSLSGPELIPSLVFVVLGLTLRP